MRPGQVVPRKYRCAILAAKSTDRFNEAGAGGAPEIEGFVLLQGQVLGASMRPGQVVPRKSPNWR